MKYLYEYFFKENIEDGEFELHFLDSGYDCLELVDKLGGQIIVLTDINMPKMNGVELIKSIREKRPDIKIFIISAYDEEEIRKEMSDIDADGYLVKPVNFIKLKDLIMSSFQTD